MTLSSNWIHRFSSFLASSGIFNCCVGKLKNYEFSLNQNKLPLKLPKTQFLLCPICVALLVDDDDDDGNVMDVVVEYFYPEL